MRWLMLFLFCAKPYFVFSFSFIFVYLKNYFKFGNNDRTVFYVCVGLFVLLLSVRVFCLYIGQGETKKWYFILAFDFPY